MAAGMAAGMAADMAAGRALEDTRERGVLLSFLDGRLCAVCAEADLYVMLIAVTITMMDSIMTSDCSLQQLDT